MEDRRETKKPRRKEETNPCAIPDDIITYNILTRVPLESLVRFRCVCKSWSNLLLDNRLFIKLHCQNQRYNFKNLSGFVYVEHEVDSISHEYTSSLVSINPNGKKRRIIPFNSSNTLFNRKVVYILHSLNGLLLLSCYHGNSYEYCVYNPITRCSTIIPAPIYDVQPGEACKLSLCYDSVIKKYKVVYCGPYRSNQLGRIKILTVGDEVDSWRNIVPPEGFDEMHHSSLYYTTMLYSYGCLLRLDASREVYEKIKLPDEVSTLNIQCVLNDMVGGDGIRLLCLSHYSIETQELMMWVLIEMGCDFEDFWLPKRLYININWLNSKEDYASFVPLAFYVTPRMKFIVARADYYYATYNNPFGILKYTYYSYDIVSHQLEIIPGLPTTGQVFWHINDFANC